MDLETTKSGTVDVIVEIKQLTAAHHRAVLARGGQRKLSLDARWQVWRKIRKSNFQKVKR